MVRKKEKETDLVNFQVFFFTLGLHTFKQFFQEFVRVCLDQPGLSGHVGPP